MSEDPAKAANAIDITEALLRQWALPQPESDDDKEGRGRIMVVGGSPEMPGAVALAANAAMRVGAGKLTIVTARTVAAIVAAAIPEARVIALAETESGGLVLPESQDIPTAVDAVLVGPGMQDEAAAVKLTRQLMTRIESPFVLDAAAMGAVTSRSRSSRGRAVILTPHAGEFAHLTGLPKESVAASREHLAGDYAKRWDAVLALKGATTVIADTASHLWRLSNRNPGLGISGSGDVLAGLIAGLAARGAPLSQAAVWGVALHANAGTRLAKRIGPLGFLARELSEEIPELLRDLLPQ
jgi:ADP-dependent NAD(P)H-hydrate dehydratase